MDPVLLAVVLVGTAVLIIGGLYFTLRGFKAADRPPIDVKPRPNPLDAATTAELRRFFEGKTCAACGRPIPPVHAFELRPGLRNSETCQAMAWEDIPSANLSATLQSHEPICPHCVIAESFRRDHPELVVDRHRTAEQH
jgi:hypothetical protein